MNYATLHPFTVIDIFFYISSEEFISPLPLRHQCVQCNAICFDSARLYV